MREGGQLGGMEDGRREGGKEERVRRGKRRRDSSRMWDLLGGNTGGGLELAEPRS